MSNERLQARLSELRREYAVGEGRLRELVQQESALRETLLRISGAIQVLEELGSAAEVEPQTLPANADVGAQPGPQNLKTP
jgi:hypothetical protein